MASQSQTVIAVAGGTGGVGKSIVKVLSAGSEFKVIVLSRKASTSLRNVTLVSVDYQSVEAMASMLESNNVHTVISALYDEAGAEQLKLIEAARVSHCTQRFIASDWGVQFPPEAVRELPFVEWRFKAIDALQGSGLEWTRVHNGYFLDYYGHSSNMTGPPFIVDVAARAAVIPGVGDEVLALTHTHDVGRFVAALLSLPAGEWEEATFMYGERVTWKDVIKTAEEITGSTFEVSHDDIETLQQCRFTPLPGHKGMGSEGLRLFALLGLYAAQGLFDTPPERSLNSRFPDIKPISVHDFMQLSWGDEDDVVDKLDRADYCSPREQQK